MESNFSFDLGLQFIQRQIDNGGNMRLYLSRQDFELDIGAHFPLTVQACAVCGRFQKEAGFSRLCFVALPKRNQDKALSDRLTYPPYSGVVLLDGTAIRVAAFGLCSKCGCSNPSWGAPEDVVSTMIPANPGPRRSLAASGRAPTLARAPIGVRSRRD